jgi:hypothetical protein
MLNKHTDREVAFVSFAKEDLTEDEIDGMQVMVRINHNRGYNLAGMPEDYTRKRIAMEFATPIPSWRILQLPDLSRDARGTVMYRGVPYEDFGAFAQD